MSESNNTIYSALANVQAKLKPVMRDRENPFFKSAYATMEACAAMLYPLLAENGLCVVGTVSADGRQWVTRIIHAATGAVIESTIPFSGADAKNAQAMGSAITYARRYGLCAAFGIVIAGDESDDDGNTASGKRAASLSIDF